MRSTWELARDSIKSLKPCVHGGEVWNAEKKVSYNRNEIVDFSSSINPLGPSQKALEAIGKNLGSIQIYPDSNSEWLREAIATSFGEIGSNNVIVGNGSTELIYLFAETFLEKGEMALIPAPTFGEYEKAVKKAGGEPRHIKMTRNLGVEPNIFTRQIKDAKIVFLCNPNNPTSALIPHDTLIKIIEDALKHDVLLFLDEDFLEFVDEGKQVSLVDKISEFPNLFVLRSFTKVFGLTGLRIGYGIASEDTIEILSNAKTPWNVNCLAQVAALASLADKEHIKKSSQVVKTERAFLTQEIAQLKCFSQYPADANFILINIKKSGFTAAQLKEKMLQQGILIRDCSSFKGLDEHHIRVAVKSRQENERLLEAFRKNLGIKT
ncbi:MAG: threonine-phosphate decarboxylase CobD [Candidatus Bathyarchaeota archaeon]|nr:threonine-phosphate decarboxylase CobD [Candidatus Bathyarchaeum sp.]